jgi:CMP-2-keto-3-deoxyoctulosonic acid synthetase
MSWPDVLGSKLLVKKGDTVEEIATSDVLKDKKYVALYFSASVSPWSEAQPLYLLRLRLISYFRLRLRKSFYLPLLYMTTH